MAGETLDGGGVDRERELGLGLADLGVVRSGAVEHERRLELAEGGLERGRVADVELGVRARRDLAATVEALGEVGRERPSPAGDQHPLEAHRTDPKRSNRGWTSCISSSQRML